MPHAELTIPKTLPLYLLKDMVVFPYMVFPVYQSDDEAERFSFAQSEYDGFIAVVYQRPDTPDLPLKDAIQSHRHGVPDYPDQAGFRQSSEDHPGGDQPDQHRRA